LKAVVALYFSCEAEMFSEKTTTMTTTTKATTIAKKQQQNYFCPLQLKMILSLKCEKTGNKSILY